MRYRIETSDSFDREVKRLSKRYLSVAHDKAWMQFECFLGYAFVL